MPQRKHNNEKVLDLMVSGYRYQWIVREWYCWRMCILSVNWRHIRLIDLVSTKGKTKVSWLISFHSLIRQCFNILCNLVCIRNIKIQWSKQPYHNNTLPLYSPLPKLGQWCDVSWPRECDIIFCNLWLIIDYSSSVIGCSDVMSRTAFHWNY